MATPANEGQPLEVRQIKIPTTEDLSNVLREVGVPTPLQKKIMERFADYHSLDLVSYLFDNLPEDIKEELERKGSAHLKEDAREEIEGQLQQKFGGLFDEYLGEVARRIFGFSLSELSGEERRQIIEIRKGLNIPGEFSPKT
jgi:hypothetical protein